MYAKPREKYMGGREEKIRSGSLKKLCANIYSREGRYKLCYKQNQDLGWVLQCKRYWSGSWSILRAIRKNVKNGFWKIAKIF
jgi:hypothetical protein